MVQEFSSSARPGMLSLACVWGSRLPQEKHKAAAGCGCRLLLHPHHSGSLCSTRLSSCSHPDSLSFCLAASAKPEGCLQHRLNTSRHRPCFLSRESMLCCRKLLVLLLGKKEDNRERQARGASPAQPRMLQALWQLVQEGNEVSSDAAPRNTVQIQGKMGKADEKQCSLQPIPSTGVGAVGLGPSGV